MSAEQSIRIANYQRPINLIEIAERGTGGRQTEATSSKSFKEMFSAELASSRSISFSKHAHERLFSRDIQLSEDKVHAIADAIDSAKAKGSKETLILSDEAAFVASVDNRTIITVFDRSNLQNGVVTHIDSAVII